MCRNFLAGAAALVMVAGGVLASHHHELNGSWQLIPRSESVTQSGTVTIDDREGNVYVSRNFRYDGEDQTTGSGFSTDAREKASIKAPGIKSKTQWKGDALEVTTTQEGAVTVERYSLRADGMMVLTVDRPGHPPETLLFQRQ